MIGYTPTLAPAAGPSPETLALQQAYAKQLLTPNDQPIHSWSQGLAGIVDALVGGTMMRKAGQRQSAAESAANDQFASLLTGGAQSPAGNGMVPGAQLPQAQAPSSPDTGFAAPASAASGGAAPAVVPSAATGAPAVSPAQMQAALAILRNPYAPAVQKALAAKMLTPVPPEYGFQVAGDQLIRTEKNSGAFAPVYTPTPKPSTDYGDYLKAKAEGFPGKYEDWQKEMKAAGRNVVSIDQRAQTAEETARGGAIVDHFKALAGDLPAADQLIQGADQLEVLLKGVDTGSEAGVRDWLRKNTGIALGDNADKLQAVSSLVDYMAPRMRVPGSGSSSDKDVEMFKSALPSLMGTPGGNQMVIDTVRAMAEHRLAIAQISEDYLTGAIESKDALVKMRSLDDPLAAFKKAAAVAPPAATPPPAAAVTTPATAAKTPPPAGWGPEWDHLTPEEQATVLAKRRSAAPVAPVPVPPVVPPMATPDPAPAPVPGRMFNPDTRPVYNPAFRPLIDIGQ